MVGGIPPPPPPAHILLVITGKFIENYIIKISEGKGNFNEKINYASNFDERHVALWYEIIRRKEIDIYRKFKRLCPLFFIKYLFFHQKIAL